MKKFFDWAQDHLLFSLSLFLLAFIPLYPKIPLVGVQHTWVYIRFEDIVVALTIFLWIFFFLRKKVTLKTPLTLPIMLFWIVGGLATLHGVMLIFPTLSNVFPNVAFLSFIRRIEYMSLFFVAFVSMRDKKYLSYVSILLALVVLAVVGYGFGQKLFGFPAFLTGNEEFAKGAALRISALGRVPSTFGGSYDLAAYLVLIVPLLMSVAFGFKNLFLKVLLLLSAVLGFGLLFLTVSRVSFLVLLLSLVLVLLLQKKKMLIVSLFVLTLIFLMLSPSLVQRFGRTVSETNVLIDAKTGTPIGQVKEVDPSYFKDKTVLRASVPKEEQATSSAVFPFALIPKPADLVTEPNASTGENLPQGTGYINLPLSPVVKRVGEYFYQKSEERKDGESVEVRVFYGDYIIKRAKAYDLSFTTRFQGEWPKTLMAFERNIILGSGYGSVSLAVDNNYLRILGESGLVGFFSFLSIFLLAGIYIKKILPNVDSPLIRNFTLGFIAGSFGLILNAVLIDVFEASKIAFTYWLLMGITLGTLHLYSRGEMDLLKELKKAVTSSYAFVVYLLATTVALYSSAYNAYFVGDDFTWLHWAAQCVNCQPLSTIVRYFTQTDGFFYRPGAKLYFYVMYQAVWLNQTIYHFVSFALHFLVSVLVYFVSKRVVKNKFLSLGSALLFLLLSGHSETVLWISATGILFNALFALSSLLFFMHWKESKNTIYLLFSVFSVFVSLLFHELGVVVPLLLILYDNLNDEQFSLKKLLRRKYYFLLLSPLLPYFALRLISQSHWFSGDYNYNLLKLPYNLVGNTLGYFALALFGPSSLTFYETARNFSKSHLLIALPISLVFIALIVLGAKKLFANKERTDKRIVVFGFLFFMISLLPFLGLGNITLRYGYLSFVGLVIIASFLLKKIYEYIFDTNGRYIALGITFLITIVFCMSHLFQLQKIQGDWQSAGEKSNEFLLSLNYVYAHTGVEKKSDVYFVDVPIKNGEAWVFPVGISDAVWFAFPNLDLNVHQAQSKEEAFSLMGSKSGKVFRFNDDGSLTELVKTRSGEIVPLIYQ